MKEHVGHVTLYKSLDQWSDKELQQIVDIISAIAADILKRQWGRSDTFRFDLFIESGGKD